MNDWFTSHLTINVRVSGEDTWPLHPLFLISAHTNSVKYGQSRVTYVQEKGGVLPSFDMLVKGHTIIRMWHLDKTSTWGGVKSHTGINRATILHLVRPVIEWAELTSPTSLGGSRRQDARSEAPTSGFNDRHLTITVSQSTSPPQPENTPFLDSSFNLNLQFFNWLQLFCLSLIQQTFKYV